MFRVMATLYPHLFDDRPELLDLALQDRVLLGRRGAHRFGADLRQALRHFRMLRRGRDLLLQPGDHVARRLRRGEEPVPAVGFERRIAELAHRRHLGQLGNALRGVGGERAQLPALMSASDDESWSPPICTRPAISSCLSGAAPLKGTCVISIPVWRDSASPITCMKDPGRSSRTHILAFLFADRSPVHASLSPAPKGSP
jgi:hypothetical protein